MQYLCEFLQICENMHILTYNELSMATQINYICTPLKSPLSQQAVRHCKAGQIFNKGSESTSLKLAMKLPCQSNSFLADKVIKPPFANDFQMYIVKSASVKQSSLPLYSPCVTLMFSQMATKCASTAGQNKPKKKKHMKKKIIFS